MPTHRFTVNVPNPTAKRTSVELRLEPANFDELIGLTPELPKEELKVLNVGIVLDPCKVRTKPNLKISLKPYTSTDVYVVVNTDRSIKRGVAAFNLIDRRDDKDVGGVLLMVVSPKYVEPPGQVINPKNPCPLGLADRMYVILPLADPSRAAKIKNILLEMTLELVVPITNPTEKPLKGAQAYLEHLGGSSVEYMPGTWNIGELAPGDVFYATWTIRTKAWHAPIFHPCVVVSSEKTDPIRLNGTAKIPRPKRIEQLDTEGKPVSPEYKSDQVIKKR